MAWIAGAVGTVLGSVGTIIANLEGDKTRRALNRARGTDPVYSQSPYAKQRLALAQQLMNARMPGAQQAEANIMSNQANYVNSLQRNATDSSQLLALGAAAEGQTNDAFKQIGMSEAQDYYNRLNNFNSASQGMTEEHRAQFDDKVRRWQDDVNITMARNAIRQQQGQNMSNLGASIGSMNFGGGGGGK